MKKEIIKTYSLILHLKISSKTHFQSKNKILISVNNGHHHHLHQQDENLTSQKIKIDTTESENNHVENDKVTENNNTTKEEIIEGIEESDIKNLTDKQNKLIETGKYIYILG